MKKITYALLEEDTVLLSQPQLIKNYGRLKAQFLCQLHYWEQKGQGVIYKGRRWVFNTADAWADQLQVSSGHFKRIVKEMLQDGIIFIEKLSPHKTVRTNYYAINHDALKALILNASNNEDKGNGHCNNLSPSPSQIEPIIVQRLTYKDNNKSERLTPQDYVPTHNQINVEKEEDSQLSVPMTKDHHNHKGIGQGIQCDIEDKKAANPKARTVVQDMIDVWNNQVSLNKKTNNIKLNREISKYLIASYKYKFNENLDDWEQYCDVITSSSYLMADAFNLSLTWALKFGTIDRLLAGELGVKLKASCMSQIPAKSLDEGRAEAIRHIDGVGESQGCKGVRRMILATLGPVQYNAWFTKVDLLDDGKTLRPHNRFVEAAIAARFGDVLKRVGR